MSLPRRRVTDRNGKWHFSKTLSVDSIIQIVGIAVVLGLPLLFWGNSLQLRVLTLENFNQAQVDERRRAEGDAREQRVTVNLQLEKMKEQMTALQISISQLIAAQGATATRSVPSVRR